MGSDPAPIIAYPFLYYTEKNDYKTLKIVEK